MSGRFGDLIKQARKDDKDMPDTKKVAQKTRKPENQKTGNPPPDIQLTEYEMVNLSIKVPKAHRIHWASEAKRNDTTLVAEISKALTKKFGLPEA